MSDLAKLAIRVTYADGREVNRNLKLTADKLGRVGDQAESAEKKITRSSGRLKVIGRDINRYVTLPLMAFAGAASKFALDLNEGLGRVETLLPGATGRIYELRDGVRELAAETGKSFNEINDGLYRTISVFQDGEDTMDRLALATKAAVAGFSSVEEAVQLASSVTRAYGDTSAEAVQKVFDLSFEAVRLGDTTFPAMASAMQVATDRAVRLNISQEELFATMSTLTGITGDASMVATQFRSAMDSLLNPTEELTQLLNRMGYESSEAALDAQGLVGVLSAIVDEADRTGLPLQKFITRKEGITLVARLAGEQLEDFNMRLTSIGSSLGALDEAYDKATNGIREFNQEINQNRQRMASAFADIGQKLLPILASLTGMIAALIEAFAGLKDGTQAVILGLGVLTAAAGMFIMTMGVIESLKLAGFFIPFANGAFYAQYALHSLTGAVISLKMVMLPLVAVIAAVVVGLTLWARKEAEATRQMEENINKINAGIEHRIALLRLELDWVQRINREAQSKVPGLRRDMRTEGFIYDMSGERKMLDDLDVQDLMSFVSEATKALNQYRDVISAADNDMEMQRKTATRLAETLKNQAEQIHGVADALHEIKFWQIGSATQQLETLRNLMADNSAEADEMRVKMRDLRDEAASTYDRPTRWRLLRDADVLDSQIKELEDQNAAYREIRTTLNQIAGIENQIAAAQAQGMSSEEYTQLVASLDIAHERLAELGYVMDDQIKSWQEWFMEITGVTIALNDLGVTAAQTWDEAIRDRLDTKWTLESFLGLSSDKVSDIESEIKEAQDHLLTMLQLDPKDILPYANAEGIMVSGEFSVADQLFLRMRKEIDALNQMLANEMYNAWEKGTEGILRHNAALSSAGVEVNNLSDLQSHWTGLVIALSEELDKLNQEAEINADRIDLLNGLIERAAENALVYKNAQEALNSELKSGNDILNDYLGTMQSLDQVVTQGWMNMWTGSSKAKIDGFNESIKILRLEMEAIASDSTLSEEERKAKMEGLTSQIDNYFSMIDLTKEQLASLGMFAEATSGIISEVLSVSVSAMTAVFYELGAAIHDSSTAMYDMEQSLKSLGYELLRQLPNLMIQAGLQLIGTPAWPAGLALIAAGLAGTVGIGWHDAEQADKVSSTRMATGGIIGGMSEYRGAMVGEAGAEGVFPLTRTQSGDLGIKATGTSEVNVSVTVINEAGENVEVQESHDEDGNVEIRLKKMFRGMVASGTADKEFRQRYRMSPVGV